jgi:hypothetical protein
MNESMSHCDHDECDHDEMVQNWIDECAANGWDLNGVPLNSDSKPSPWVDARIVAETADAIAKERGLIPERKEVAP